MTLRPLFPLVVALACAQLASAQTLVCPASPAVASRPCDAYHYHVAMYRPDSRAFVEVYGVNQFASQSACDRARDAAMKRNLDVVTALRQRDTQYQVDRFGPCHCDLSIDKSSPNYLTDLQRIAQVRQAEEIRQHVRERLLDNKVPSDSELIRGLLSPPSITPLLGGAKLVPLPAVATPSAATNSPNDLKATKAIESAAPALASLDLPLVEIAIAGVAPDLTPPIAPPTPAPSTANPPPAQQALPEERVAADPLPPTPPPVAPRTVVPTTAPAPDPQPTVPAAVPIAVPAPAPVDTEPAPQPADETAEVFVAFETERIQNVLKASGAFGDEAIRSRIFEACMQRIQLLSNLRSLIAGSGAHSRLAAAVRNIRTEADRLAFVANLFGRDMPAHWAPGDAKDVVLEAKPDVDNDAEKILRDASGRWPLQQKKHALYILLARTQPTEEQQLWLGGVIDAFLQ
jgi:hypothetical protein